MKLSDHALKQTMKINRGYKTELDPNNVQRTVLIKHAGTARFAYNWGLALWREQFEKTGKGSNAIELHKRLNALKKTEYPWMYEVSKWAPQNALRHLERAFKNFFEKRSKYPKFRSKKYRVDSFTLDGLIKVFSNSIHLPRIGRVRLKEKDYIPVDGVRILSATVSQKAGRWFVSVQVEEEIEVVPNIGPIVGVDIGISQLAAISDGRVVPNPKALSCFERKKRRLQRSLSRKNKTSNNRIKAKISLARCEFRIANIRMDAHHKATTMLAKTKSVIGVESLNVAGLMKNHCLAKHLGDAGFGEFLRQLEYKSKWNGSTVVAADPFFPSTKRCSTCGTVKEEMPLSVRIYLCESCGFEANRDLNAALNLAFVAASWVETLTACKR